MSYTNFQGFYWYDPETELSLQHCYHTRKVTFM